MYLDQRKRNFPQNSYLFEFFDNFCSLNNLEHYQPLGFYAEN